MLAEGKVLLCSLASGLLGDEAAALLGALIVAEVWHATTARAASAAEQSEARHGLSRRVPALRPPANFRWPRFWPRLGASGWA